MNDKRPPPSTAASQIVLNEDAWLAAMEEIIDRDFFPDLRSAGRPEGRVDVTGLSLDEFLHTYTSEDNASFRELLDRTNAVRRQKVAHLMLPPADKTGVADKKHEAVNLLMYDGGTRSSLPLCPVDAGNDGARKKMIRHKATSFARAKEESEPGDRPPPERRQEYELLETPSFEPGEDMTPFMTWGTLEATPQRLDDDEDNLRRPRFTMRDTPLREQLAHSLGRNASSDSIFARDRTRYTPRAISKTPSGTPSRHAMSPAARRLASTIVKGKRSGASKASIFNDKRTRSSWNDA
jgi:protein DGCR14